MTAEQRIVHYVLTHSLMKESLPRDITKAIRWVVTQEKAVWVAEEEYLVDGKWVHQDFTGSPDDDPSPGVKLHSDTLVELVIAILGYETANFRREFVELLEAFDPPLENCHKAEVLLRCQQHN